MEKKEYENEFLLKNIWYILQLLLFLLLFVFFLRLFSKNDNNNNINNNNNNEIIIKEKYHLNKNNSIKLIENEKCGLNGRIGSCICTNNDDGIIYLFGGINHDDIELDNILYEYNIRNKKYYFNNIYNYKKLKLSKRESTNSFSKLGHPHLLETNKYLTQENLLGPPSRIYGNLIYIKNKSLLLLMNGIDINENYMEDIYIFNIKEKKWYPLLLLPNYKEFNKIPKYRYYSSLISLNNNQIILFGGITNKQNINENKILNDCWLIELDDEYYKKDDQIEGSIPIDLYMAKCTKLNNFIYSKKNNNNKIKLIPRYGHTSIIYNNNLLLLGGKNDNIKLYNNKIDILDLNTYKWSRKECIGNIPKLELGISAHLLEPNDRGIIVIDSSYNNNNIFNNIFLLKIINLNQNINNKMFNNNNNDNNNNKIIEQYIWYTIPIDWRSNSKPPGYIKSPIISNDNHNDLILIFGGEDNNNNISNKTFLLNTFKVNNNLIKNLNNNNKLIIEYDDNDSDNIDDIIYHSDSDEYSDEYSDDDDDDDEYDDEEEDDNYSEEEYDDDSNENPNINNNLISNRNNII